MITLPIFVSSVLLSVTHGVAEKQQVRAPADSLSSVAVMRRVKDRPESRWLIELLRQTRNPIPASTKREIADSLVARANKRIDENSQVERANAINSLNALIQAGSKGWVGGAPYDGAIDAIHRISVGATSLQVRARALGGMLAVGPHQRALLELQRVAVSDDPLAYDAVAVLVMNANGGSWSGVRPDKSEQDASDAALRSLWSRRSVKNSKAEQLLSAWIERK